jgi:hypothetical protein
MAVAAGAGLLGAVRGLLVGSGRYRAAAVVIGGETVVRLVVGAALLMAGGGPLLLAAALATSAAVALLWPGILRVPGPRLVSAMGGSETEVTALFAALALFRAPYLVALGLTVRATAPLTRLVEEGGRGWRPRPVAC